MSGGNERTRRRISKDYVQGLEKERCKIQMFQRELPLSFELVTKAIETCKEQLSLSGSTCEYNFLSQWEFPEQTRAMKKMEEFMPLKRVVSEKSEWLRTVHLWNQSSDPPPQKISQPTEAAPAPDATSPGTGGARKKQQMGGKTQRKIRRNWSPELHQRFLHALEHLGGSQLATPKRIKELMKEDGLSSDEIKSHLQKYRLQATKRPSVATAQPPQQVAPDGIWVPPEFTSKATTTAPESNK